MDNDTIFLYIIAAAALFCAYNLYSIYHEEKQDGADNRDNYFN